MPVFGLRRAERGFIRRGKMTLSFLLVLLLSLKSLVAAFDDCCRVEWYPNGTLYTLREHVKSCENFNWLLDDTVISNEEDLGTTMVHSRGPRFIVLHSCQENVSYRSMCSPTPCNCFTPCPTTPRPDGVTSTFDGRSSTEAWNHHAAIVGCSVVAGVVLCVGVLWVLWLKKDQVRRCCHPMTASGSTCVYRAAESGGSAPN